MIMSSLVVLLLSGSGADGPDLADAHEEVAGVSAMDGAEWRVATAEDIERLKGMYGVGNGREVPAIIDGFGTGLTPNTEQEWEMLVGRLLIFETIEAPTALPPSFDFSTDPEFPAVGNQMAQGSCSAWAGTYYSYGYLEAVDNEWTEASLGNDEQLLSPAWTYNMVNGGRDSGSWIDTNMMVIVDWGVPSLARMPYDDDDFTSWGSPEAFREAPLHRALEVGYLEYSPSETIDAIKTLVSGGTPVAFALDADQFFWGFQDDNYIISSSEYSSSSLNHAQTIVGFDDAVVDDSDSGAFRVVNSWGTGFGESGYYWLTYDTIKELGNLGILTLNFIVDVPDYVPSLLAVWHYNDEPVRSAGISAGLSSEAVTIVEKIPYFDGGSDPQAREPFPTFMCLDLTEFSEEYWLSSYDVFLSIGDSRTTGHVSSFKIEAYETAYVPGVADLASAQSSEVPQETPCTVHNRLEYYSPMSYSDALDTEALGLHSYGQASWVGVDHHSSSDGDSLQSGDVSDGGLSVLELEVEGPMTVGFDWQVSSQSGLDVLEFTVDGIQRDQIAGDASWARVSEAIGSGEHTLAWSYHKDVSTSSLGDCGWVDALELVPEGEILPVIELAPSYQVYAGELFTITPVMVECPPGAELTVFYDWGDMSDWAASSEEDGYSASHVYQDPGELILWAYAQDTFGHNVSDSSPLQVLVRNEIPLLLGLEFSPGGIVEPGETVTFVITVLDKEGDELTVVAGFGDGSQEMSVVLTPPPRETAQAAFDHAYSAGSDDPFAAVFTVRDDAEHSSTDWQCFSVGIVVNTAPTAVLASDSGIGQTGLPMSFDASDSHDLETSFSELMFRYDWTSDGIWDTDWVADSLVTHAYDYPGTYDVRVEVMDGVGLTSTAEVTIEVSGEAIPEFSTVVLPVITLIALFLLVRTRGRRPGSRQ